MDSCIESKKNLMLMEYGLPHDQLKKKNKDTPMGTPFNCSKKKR